MIKYLDGVAEKIAYIIAKILVKVGVKPVNVTIFRFISAALTSWYFFSSGKYLYNVIGLLLYMSLAILDWADGDMAQIYKLPKETAPLGRLIDHTSDRILMMIVLASIFFGGIKMSSGSAWTILAILYFSIFFYLTVSLYEFDKMFGLEFDKYPEIERKILKNNNPYSITDRVIYNFLYVHNNSITRICFTHNYLLIFGIIFNQLFFSLAFLATMHLIRSTGIFWITYQTLKIGENNSALVKILRTYKSNQDKKIKLLFNNNLV